MTPKQEIPSIADFYEKYVPDPPPLDEDRAKHTVYSGIRDPTGDATADVLIDGVPDVLPWRLDLYNHSPTGLEWGYGGSGPHQLALAILAHATGDDAYAIAKHWDYASEYTSRLAREGFEIGGGAVLVWVRHHPITKEQRFNYLPRKTQGELMDRSIAEDFLSECCGADQTYLAEKYEGGRKSFAVCSSCGSKYEF